MEWVFTLRLEGQEPYLLHSAEDVRVVLLEPAHAGESRQGP